MSNSQINVIGNTARSLRHLAPGRSELHEAPLKPLKERDVLVRTLYSGISRGTERLVFNGQVPRSEWQTMRCPNQEGEFSYPVTYGYACVGKVIEIGSEVNAIKEGQCVFVLHPHQDRFIVDSKSVTPLPEGLDPKIAVLTANMETALNAVWDADMERHHRTLLVGAGVVGLLTAHIVKSLSETTPLVTDIDLRKKSVTENLGFEFISADELIAQSGSRFDRLFNTTASGQGLQLAIDHSDFEANIIEMSWYGDRKANISLGGAFHSNRLKIISSQVGHVSPEKRSSCSPSDRIRIAMGYLKDPALQELLDPIMSFSTLPTEISNVLDSSSNALCPLITYMD